MINLLYCGDRNAETGITLSLLSALRVSKEPLQVAIFTLSYRGEGYDIQPFRRSLAEYMDAYSRKVHPFNSVRLYNLQSEFATALPKANMGTRFTPCCMLRLYADLVPNLPNRLLYLDYDVVARQDFSAFFHQDMCSVELAGVPDYYGRWFYSRPLWQHNYMNSGVLLMNMDEIRRSNLMERCRYMCSHEWMFLPDQHALNRLCKSRRLWDSDYNEQRHLRPTTVLQHFSTTFRVLPYPHKVSVKPWQKEAVHRVFGVCDYDNLLAETELIMKEVFTL